MRLSSVERGDGLKPRLIYRVIRVMSGFRAPDVIRTLFYRKKFFGEPHSRHTQAVMRGPSVCSVVEIEQIDAYGSDVDMCRF